MKSTNPASVRSVMGWVGPGANVVIEGAYGSGRSTVLREVAEALRRRGRETLLVRGLAAATSIPLGPFLLQSHLADELSEAPTVPEVVSFVAARLRSRGAVLLIDDLKYLDLTTAAVLEAVVEDRMLQVVCVCDVGPAHPLVGRLARRAACARVEPLGLRAMTRLLSAHVGSDLDPSVAAEITRKSAGNPGVALALVNAAVHSGTLTRKNGLWSLTANLDSLPLRGVVNASLVNLPPKLYRALAAVALSGPVPLETARRMVTPKAFAGLVDRGHIATSRIGGGLQVFVSSPALATALVAELPPVDRYDLEAHVRAVLREEGAGGGGLAAVAGAVGDGSPGDATTRGPLSVGEPIESPDSLSTTVTVLTERARTEAEHLWDTWRQEPTPVNGVPLLKSLMLQHRASTMQIEAVLRSTRDRGGLAFEAGWFLILRARWAAWTGADFDLDAAVAELGGSPAEFGSTPACEVFYACARLRVAAVETGPPPEGVPVTDVSASLRLIDRVTGLLDRGAVGKAVAIPLLIGGNERALLGDMLDALQVDVLVLAGRLTEARRRARANLDAAYAAFDLLRIRFAARSVATVAFCRGDLDGAWRALSSVLLLGPTGPMTESIDQRILGLASIVRSRAGDVRMAESLLGDLEKIPEAYRTGLDFVGPWAEAELLLSADSWNETAADLLWTAGEEFVAKGDLTAGLACWALTATPLPTERLQRLEKVWAEADVPFLAPLVDLHRLLASGTSDELLEALREPSITGPVVRNALVVVEQRRAAENGSPLTDDEILAKAGPAVLNAVERSPGDRAEHQVLSDREREIVAMARAGRSNAEIAAELFLSRRTVENHLYRALRKLGISGRGELLSG